MAEVENCMHYSLPLDVPILARFFCFLFSAFCFFVCSDPVLWWRVYSWLPSCYCILPCSLYPEWPIFLFIVATALFQIHADLWTRTHYPPYLFLPRCQSGCSLLLVEIRPCSLQWVPWALSRVEMEPVITWEWQQYSSTDSDVPLSFQCVCVRACGGVCGCVFWLMLRARKSRRSYQLLFPDWKWRWNTEPARTSWLGVLASLQLVSEFKRQISKPNPSTLWINAWEGGKPPGRVALPLLLTVSLFCKPSE